MDARLTPRLAPDRVLIAPSVTTKWELIDRLIEPMAAIEGLPSGAKEAVHERESQVSTGLEAGIALPHGMLRGDFATLGALAILPSGLEFEAMDGLPARFVLAMLFPDSDAGRALHVTLLASSLRLFTDEALAESLMRAGDPAAALAALSDAEARLGV